MGRLQSLNLALVLSLICSPALATKDSVNEQTLAQAASSPPRQNRKSEADRLLKQGIKQLNIKQVDAALQSLQQALAIYKEIKDRPGQGETLKNLGNVYTNKKDNAKAIEAYEQSLVIAREIKDSDLEGRNLLNLGIVYNSIKNYDKALEFLLPTWEIAQGMKSSELQFKVLSQLSSTYTAKGDIAKAQIYQKKFRTKFPEVFKLVETILLYSQLEVYSQKKESQKAIDVGQEALEKIRKVNLSEEDVFLLTSSSEIDRKALSPDTIKKVFEFRILLELLQLYDDITDYPKVINVGEQALGIIRKFSISKDEWNALNIFLERKDNTSFDISKKTSEMGGLLLLGNAYNQSGKYQKAIPLTQEALKIAKEVKNTDIQGAALIILANTYKSIAISDAEVQKTLTFAQEALTIARRTKNEAIESEALNEIADIYSKLEEYQKAIEFAEASLVIARRSKDPVAIVKPLFTLASVYVDLGEYQKFNQLSQEALATVRKVKQNPTVEAASFLLASVNQFIQGDYKKTITYAQESLDIASSIKTPYYKQWFLMRNYRLLSIGYGGLKDYQKAIEFAKKDLQIGKDLNEPISQGYALRLLGAFYRGLGQKQEALAAYLQVLDLAKQKEYSGSLALVYAGLARVYRDLNQPTAAITYYQQAIDDIEESRGKIRGLSRELQTSFLQSLQEFDRTSNADIYREYANLLLSQGRNLEASQVLELLKVQELSEFKNNPSITASKKPVVQTRIEDKITKKYGSLIAFGQKVDECQKNNCPEKTKLADERDALISEFSQTVQRLEKDVRDRLSKDRGNLDTQDVRSIGKKIVEAKEGTILINIFVVQDKTWLLWVSKGGVVKSLEVPLGEPKLRETVNQFRQLLQNPNSDINQIKATGKQLYDWLIRPIEPELKANKIQNLVFSLDRAARYIPISALFDGNQYLVENYNISTVLSAGLTDTESRLPVGTANTQVLALGLSNPVPGFSALPNVPAELNAIVRQKPNDRRGVYPGDEFLNQQFDYRTLRDNLKGRKILHIATHGVFVPGRQNESYLLLGTGEKLPISKIENLEDLSDVHLVVLSACETALGETAKDGIEISGISFYFLNRRAKAVIASLWLVNDASTTQLMQQFYTNLATDNHPTKPEALRQSQLSLLYGKNSKKTSDRERGAIEPKPIAGKSPRNQHSGTGYSHPYYWAPFILIGNGL
ncbi:MAG: CHAT domain-containing protein [Cyanomargarita calcarea GSE-NOS-MK-12-04C]|jgi:CHAT domain-containing protein/lipopolysaccharide biosynthesis regulator YciM|uniref:CHAT domain-containing protein n=1 Tax=Cyanomargarita calcarea GSE-NOS-MK-12-04C TaxID=2839659 RepID=A0A951QQX0_9CYAN|nr:CHAT domain-containing protein [Cyanomargarita calcarea GSE-NOS-MK-12-04C]